MHVFISSRDRKRLYTGLKFPKRDKHLICLSNSQVSLCEYERRQVGTRILWHSGVVNEIFFDQCKQNVSHMV